MVKKLKKRPQDLARMETEIKIIQILTEAKARVRWKDLLEKTEISSRTLADRLKELGKKGVVRRIVDSSVYPPAVYYEAASEAYLARLPVITMFDQVRNMLDNLLQTRRIIETGKSNPEQLVEQMLLGYVWDLIFTINYCLDQKEWPFLVYYHVRAYESKIMELVRIAKETPKLHEAIKEVYANFKKERMEERQKLTDQLIVNFKDKELAKPMIQQYCVMLIEGMVKTPTDFLQQLSSDKQLLEKIEKDFGQPIEKSRLRSFMEDSAWKTQFAEKKTIIEAIEQAEPSEKKTATVIS